MAHGTNECFLPYHVHVLAPGETPGPNCTPVECWSAVWLGREYQPLHRGPIPLNREPQDQVLREYAFAGSIRRSEGGGVDERDDGSVSTVLPYDDVCDPGGDEKLWADYAKRLGKLVRHLNPDMEECTTADDPCQPDHRR